MIGRRSEEYLEGIYDIVLEKGYARVKDVSEALGVGFSAVSEMFHKLGEEGYVNYEKYGGVTLTTKGEAIAEALSKKHEVLREFFIILGIDERVADEDACEIEHVVTPETMDRLTQFVEFINLHEQPLWLDRFKDYYETGRLGECPRLSAETKTEPDSDD